LFSAGVVPERKELTCGVVLSEAQGEERGRERAERGGAGPLRARRVERGAGGSGTAGPGAGVDWAERGRGGKGPDAWERRALRGLLVCGSGTRRKAARVTGAWERAAGEGVGLLAGRAGEGGGKVAG
jgi:hypothetical protein